MAGFDDELRAALRERAGRVPTPPDVGASVERRARRIHRRRTALSGTAVVAVTAAIALGPSLARMLADSPLEATDAPPTAEGAAVDDVRGSPGTIPDGAPENVLRWGTRGTTLPSWCRDATNRWLARDAGNRGADPSETHIRTLWRGGLPDGRWARLAQVWNPTDPRRRDAWSTVLLVAHPGGRVTNPYDYTTRFLHQRPGETAEGTAGQIERIAGYSFGLGDYLLVVGSPEAATAALTVDGRHLVRRPLRGGATTIPVPDQADGMALVQLRDARGNLLTPGDAASAAYAERGATVPGWRPDLPLHRGGNAPTGAPTGASPVTSRT